MGHTRKTEQEPEKQLWEQLDKVRAGMLGIEGSHNHMQPMAHQADQDGHACLMGELSESRDRSKVDAYWNDHVAAWWTSKSDPDIALLEFDLLDAAIWASTKKPIRYAWEIQSAKDSPKEPDLGARAHLDFTQPRDAPGREESGKRN